MSKSETRHKVECTITKRTPDTCTVCGHRGNDCLFMSSCAITWQQRALLAEKKLREPQG